MSDLDVQWPSEDEDFDAVSTPFSSDMNDDQVPISGRPVAPRAVQIQDIQGVPAEAPVAEQHQPSESVTSEPAVEAPAEPAPEAPPSSLETQAVPETTPKPVTAPVATATAALNTIVAPPVAVTPAKATKLPEAPRVKGSRSYVHLAVEAVLVLALIGVGFYAYNLQGDKKDLKTQVSQLNSNPQAVVQKQTTALINQVGALMQLPNSETPTIANVSDASQAKQQSAFFANAQNGDKVLMYVKAGEAILYRPSTNRIVLVAPLTFNNSAATATK